MLTKILLCFGTSYDQRFFNSCAVTNMEGFNSHLNMEQMNKALISLNDMYEKASQHGQQNENGKSVFVLSFFLQERGYSNNLYMYIQSLSLEHITCSP